MNDCHLGMRRFIMMLLMKDVLSALVSSATELSPSLNGPKNTIVVVGGRAELKCNINNESLKVSWEFFSFGGTQQETIYYGDDIIDTQKSKYRINKTMPGQHDLIIDHVDMNHAGRYKCSSGNQIKTSAQLTVLVSDPHCEADSGDRGLKENKTLRLQCNVTYMGNLIPVFVWTKEDKKYEPVTTTYNGTGPTSIISMLMKQLNRSDNGAIFASKVIFQFPNKSEANVPNYLFTWNHKAAVLYGPRNIKIESNSSSLKYRDHLECSADGNPIPTYKWTLDETDITIDGPLLTLGDSLSTNKNYTFICTAINDVDSDSKAITIYLTMKDTDSISTVRLGSTFGFVAGLLIVIVLLVIGLCLVIGERGKVKEKAIEIEDSARKSMQPAPSPLCEPPREFNEHSVEENSPTSLQVEMEERSASARSQPYCVLQARPLMAQEPSLYCELRLKDTTTFDYVNLPSAEKPHNKKRPVYDNILQV